MAGIIDTIKLGGTLILAIPAALFGLEALAAGQVVYGGLILTLAVGLVVIQHYLTLPTDVPEMLLGRVVGAITKDPEEVEEN